MTQNSRVESEISYTITGIDIFLKHWNLIDLCRDDFDAARN